MGDGGAGDIKVGSGGGGGHQGGELGGAGDIKVRELGGGWGRGVDVWLFRGPSLKLLKDKRPVVASPWPRNCP